MGDNRWPSRAVNRRDQQIAEGRRQRPNWGALERHAGGAEGGFATRHLQYAGLPPLMIVGADEAFAHDSHRQSICRSHRDDRLSAVDACHDIGRIHLEVAPDRAHKIEEAGEQAHIRVSRAAGKNARAAVAIEPDDGALLVEPDRDPPSRTGLNLVAGTKEQVASCAEVFPVRGYDCDLAGA